MKKLSGFYHRRMKIKLCFLVLTLLLSLKAFAFISTKLIARADCKLSEVLVTYTDSSSVKIPIKKDYKCSEVKISEDRKFAGHKIIGEISAETGSEKRKFPDALLYVLIEGQSYLVTENARYIPNWFFVHDQQKVVIETAFEHGPSTHVLYDLNKKTVVENCSELALTVCKGLSEILNKKKDPYVSENIICRKNQTGRLNQGLEGYKRFRLVSDLNFDGIPDLILDGAYIKVAKTFLHPMAVNSKKQSSGTGQLNIYSKESVDEGNVITYHISEEEFIKSNVTKIKSTSAEYRELFEKNPLPAEYAYCLDGSLIWNPKYN